MARDKVREAGGICRRILVTLASDDRSDKIPADCDSSRSGTSNTRMVVRAHLALAASSPPEISPEMLDAAGGSFCCFRRKTLWVGES